MREVDCWEPTLHKQAASCARAAISSLQLEISLDEAFLKVTSSGALSMHRYERLGLCTLEHVTFEFDSVVMFCFSDSKATRAWTCACLCLSPTYSDHVRLSAKFCRSGSLFRTLNPLRLTWNRHVFSRSVEHVRLARWQSSAHITST